MTPRCGHCRHWSPLWKDRNFLGRCIAPQRPADRTTDRIDTCNLFEAMPSDNVVKEYLD